MLNAATIKTITELGGTVAGTCAGAAATKALMNASGLQMFGKGTWMNKIGILAIDLLVSDAVAEKTKTELGRLAEAIFERKMFEPESGNYIMNAVEFSSLNEAVCAHAMMVDALRKSETISEHDFCKLVGVNAGSKKWGWIRSDDRITIKRDSCKVHKRADGTYTLELPWPSKLPEEDEEE